jgi:predicted DNA-binding transcriptional regulator AlpA
MSGKKATNKLFAPAASTLDRVLSERETAELLHCCTKTLRQEFAAGRAPARVRLSARRIGYRLSAIYRWLDTRVEAPPGGGSDYNADNDFARSYDECLRAVRERMDPEEGVIGAPLDRIRQGEKGS